MNNDLKRNIILEHYQNSPYKNRINDDQYTKINSNNVSCIDNIDLYFKIENDVIEDIKFDGEACVISTSTTSIMCDLLKNKKVPEAIQIIENYLNMIDEKEYDSALIKDAIVFNETYKQPSRKKCATLTWQEIYKYLLNYQKNKN